MNATKQVWVSPELSLYGNVEDITEQSGTVTKGGGSGDSITVTVNGVVTPVATGAAAGSSLINIRRN